MWIGSLCDYIWIYIKNLDTLIYEKLTFEYKNYGGIEKLWNEAWIPNIYIEYSKSIVLWLYNTMNIWGYVIKWYLMKEYDYMIISIYGYKDMDIWMWIYGYGYIDIDIRI